MSSPRTTGRLRRALRPTFYIEVPRLLIPRRQCTYTDDRVSQPRWVEHEPVVNEKGEVWDDVEWLHGDAAEEGAEADQ